jgi:hypothetical protein
MRYHHGCGCYGHGDTHWGCGPGPVHGPGYGYGYGYGWDAPDDDPRPYRRRGRFGGAVARQSTATQLEAYLASLRDEIRAAEQDLRDLGMAEDTGVGKDKA